MACVRTHAYTLDPDPDAIDIMDPLEHADHASKDEAEQWLRDIGADYALTEVYDEDPDGFPPPDPIQRLSWSPGYGWAAQ